MRTGPKDLVLGRQGGLQRRAPIHEETAIQEHVAETEIVMLNLHEFTLALASWTLVYKQTPVPDIEAGERGGLHFKPTKNQGAHRQFLLLGG